MPKPPRIRAAVLAAAVLLPALITGCARGPAAQARGPAEGGLSGQKLSWKDCPAPSEAEGGGSAPTPLPNNGRWQCATMKAPLNWNAPESGTIDIAL
ncbi:alpha/beta hydrolase, partial [Streptomyces sp. NPDC001020]